MKIKYHDIELLNKLLEMEGGYVLDFTDKTINLYFAEELNIDFSDEIFLAEGWSKAKRMRCFLKITERDTVIIVLNSLWQYKKNKFPGKVSPQDDSQFIQLIQRLHNADYETAHGIKPATAYTPQVNMEHFKQSLNEMWDLDAQARGFKFEVWLNELFQAYHLMPRSSFRMKGEQIDGSFQLDQETYLVEAKWKKDPIGAADLHILEGKLGQKASWARGIFISFSGFSEDALQAWGRAKRVVCVSGADIYYSFEKEIAFPELLQAKIRRAAETGEFFTPIEVLFPNKTAKK